MCIYLASEDHWTGLLGLSKGGHTPSRSRYRNGSKTRKPPGHCGDERECAEPCARVGRSWGRLWRRGRPPTRPTRPAGSARPTDGRTSPATSDAGAAAGHCRMMLPRHSRGRLTCGAVALQRLRHSRSRRPRQQPGQPSQPWGNRPMSRRRPSAAPSATSHVATTAAAAHWPSACQELAASPTSPAAVCE